MKLKNLASSTEDRLKRFIEYVENINISQNLYKSKHLFYNDENGFYLNSFERKDSRIS